MKVLYLIILSFLVYSCSNPVPGGPGTKGPVEFAANFRVYRYSEFTKVIILNPWQRSNGESFSYIVCRDPSILPDSLANSRIIKAPVENVITLSSTHIGFISALGKSASVAGVSGKDFITDTIVRSSIDRKKCFDIGFAPDLDFELILSLNPGIVFLYGLDPSVASLASRLQECGINSVIVSEFLEFHPLGKAEWIKFFSVFYNCEDLADSIFNQVKHNYLELSEKAGKYTQKPEILLGLPWKDTWYMAGGGSFTARLIEDAGGSYLWKDDPSPDYIPLDLESVFNKAVNADIWINTGAALSKSDITSYDSRFGHLPAFINGHIYNNNLRLNASGGNDFWESGAVYPDRILEDLIGIFHPDETRNTAFYYYRKLE